MMGELAALITAAALLLGSFVAYRKWGPEARKLKIETVDVNVTIADRVRDIAVRDWERIDAEMEDLRREFNQYRADTTGRLAEMAAELRAEKAEKQHVKEENGRLRVRVQTLEAEVRALKANGGPHSPT